MVSSRKSRSLRRRHSKRVLLNIDRSRGLVEPLEPRLLLAVRSWIGGATGNWEDATNWSDNLLPTAEDSAVIADAGTTITINSNVTVDGIDAQGSLELLGGTLDAHRRYQPGQPNRESSDDDPTSGRWRRPLCERDNKRRRSQLDCAGWCHAGAAWQSQPMGSPRALTPTRFGAPKGRAVCVVFAGCHRDQRSRGCVFLR